MKIDSARRRLAALEGGDQGDDELVRITFQWENADGSVRGRKIKRLVAKRRFNWLKSIPDYFILFNICY
jgi:hypothetical protein